MRHCSFLSCHSFGGLRRWFVFFNAGVGIRIGNGIVSRDTGDGGSVRAGILRDKFVKIS